MVAPSSDPSNGAGQSWRCYGATAWEGVGVGMGTGETAMHFLFEMNCSQGKVVGNVYTTAAGPPDLITSDTEKYKCFPTFITLIITLKSV